MPVLNASVHLITKQAQAHETEIRHPEAVLEPGQRLDELHTTIASTYTRRTHLHVGKFNANTDSFPFSTWLTSFREGNGTFLDFTRRSSEHLRVQMADEFLSVGGHVLFIHYEQGGDELLLVAKVQRSEGKLFDESLTHVLDAEYLDLGELQMAGRVNFARWDGGEQNYVTFVNRREQGRLSEYFVRFLGCEVPSDARAETGRLVQVIVEYCEAHVPDTDQQIALKHRVFDHLKEQASKREPVFLETVANLVDPQEPLRFREYLNTRQAPPSDGFAASAAAARTLIGYSFRSKDLTLRMSSEFFRDHDVQVTQDNRLIINNIPDALRDELSK